MAVDMTEGSITTPPAGRRWSRGRLLIIAGSLLALLLVSGIVAFVAFQPIQVLPRIRLAPGFALIDQSNETVTSEDMRGRFVLYGFNYSSCDTCDGANETMADIAGRLDEVNLRGFPVSLISISIDPGRDTPDVLADYAGDLGADGELWSLATTENPALLKAIVGGGFKTYYEYMDDGSILLDRAFVLVDGNGIVRGEYRYQTQAGDSDRILRHLNMLAEEVENASGAAGLAYEAAHFFLCYAP